MSLPTSSTPVVTVEFGQGDKRYTTTSTIIGEQAALVLPGVPNLISPVQMLDAGGGLHLWSDSGYIENEEGTASIPIARKGAAWICNLEDVVRYRAGQGVPVNPPLESTADVIHSIQS